MKHEDKWTHWRFQGHLHARLLSSWNRAVEGAEVHIHGRWLLLPSSCCCMQAPKNLSWECIWTGRRLPGISQHLLVWLLLLSISTYNVIQAVASCSLPKPAQISLWNNVHHIGVLIWESVVQRCPSQHRRKSTLWKHSWHNSREKSFTLTKLLQYTSEWRRLCPIQRDKREREKLTFKGCPGSSAFKWQKCFKKKTN